MQNDGPQPGQPGSGKDLPAVLRRLSLVGQQGSAEGAVSDDMATLPPRRKLNFFSSLRLRKREASQSEVAVTQVDGQDKIMAILANLRNKGQHCSVRREGGQWCTALVIVYLIVSCPFVSSV